MTMIPNRMFLLAIFLISLVIFRPGSSGAADRPGLPDWLTAPGDDTGRQSVMFVFGHFDDDSVRYPRPRGVEGQEAGEKRLQKPVVLHGS